MKTFIYESPKRERRHSAPIAASDTAARQFLEARGWRIVETHEAEPDAEDTALLPVPEPTVEDPFAELGDTLKVEQVDALRAAGYDSLDALRAATDDDLRNVEGIGPASVKNLRAKLLPKV